MMRPMLYITLLIFLVAVIPAGTATAGNGKGSNGNGSQSSNGNGSSNNVGDYGRDKGDGDDTFAAGGNEDSPGIISSPEGSAANSDQNFALRAVQRGDALPLSEMAKRVRHLFGARLLDARLLTEGSKLIYHLTILTDQGASTQVSLDAKTGVLIGIH